MRLSSSRSGKPERSGKGFMPRTRPLTRLLPLAALALALALAAAGCGSTSSGSSGGGGKLNLVAYSTPQEAYAKLIPAFQKTAGGKGVSFSQSYGASGDQSRAVES